MTERDLRLLLDDAAADEGRSALSATVLASRARGLRRRRRMAVAGASGAVAALTVGAVLVTATNHAPARTPEVAKTSPSPTTGTDTSTSASCASRVVIDGVGYGGLGGFERTPELTGRTLKATRPSCIDTAGGSDPPDQVVTVYEIVGIPPETAVWSAGLWYTGTLMLRSGSALPAEAKAWGTPPTCRKDGPTVLIGEWLGIDPKNGGDRRPVPYVTLVVDRTVPAAEELERWKLRIHIGADASPELDKHLSKKAPGSARAFLQATVHCEGKRFVADSFEQVPR